MDLQKWTLKAQEALQEAQRAAQEAKHPELTPEHLLAALLKQADGTAAAVLEKAGARRADVSADLARELDKRPEVSGESDLAASSSFRRVLNQAEKEMAAL